MTKRPRCALCKKAFTPPRRGRPPRYCCASHRQRAYENRRVHKLVPQLLLGRDMDDIRTRAGIERVVEDVLRQHQFLPPAFKRPTRLRLVKDDNPER